MNLNNFLRTYLKITFVITTAIFLFGAVGCGPNSSEREKLATEKREEIKQQRLKKELEVVDGLRKKYQPIDFPWGVGVEVEESTFFSALAQRFLLENKQKPIILMMDLEDVEQSRNGLIAKFVMTIGRPLSIEIPKELKLSLAISEEQFTELRAMRPKMAIPRKYSRHSIAVVAKINELTPMKSTIHDDEGKSSLKSEIYGTGLLLDAKLRIEQ